MADEALNASSHIVEEQSESVAATNLKVGGDFPAFMIGLSYNQALHQQGMRHQQDLDAAAGWRAINQATVTKSIEDLLTTNVREGAADLLGFHIGGKVAQTMPPVTAPPPAV